MTSENNGMYMPVAPAYANNGGMLGGDGAWWLIILFLFAMNGGWGNGFGNNGMMPWMMTQQGTGSEVQRGFDQQALVGGINGIQSALCNGFAQAEVSNNSRQMANMNQLFGIQTTIDGRLDGLALNLQNCCCENRAATADLKYTMATEAANTRANCDANNQKILDKLCQLELEGVKQNYEGQLRAMQNQLNAAQTEIQGLRDSVARTADRAAIIANNEAQTTALEQYLAPNPKPCYVVQNPNCCNYAYSGCGAMA